MVEGNGIVRFIHTADWHLGLTKTSLRDKNGMPKEYIWVKNSAIKIADYAEENGIKLALLCGDILQSHKPSPTVENLLAEIIDRFIDAGMKVVYLIGNHEVPSWGDHPAKIYDTLDIEGVIIADDIAVHNLEVDGKVIQIATIPSNVLQNVSFDDALAQVVGQISEKYPAVLMSHIFVDGAKLSGSDISLLPNEAHTSPVVIKNLPFQYVALGHIHRYQQISSEPVAVYSGSLQRTSFAEGSETKGFVDVEIFHTGDEFSTEYHFVPVNATKFITVDVDIRGIEDGERRICERISALPVEGAMLKVKILRRRDDAKISLPQIRKWGREKGAIYVTIEDKVERNSGKEDLFQQKPTGSIIADVERYIDLEMPGLVNRKKEIIRIIEEFDREVN